MMKKNDNLNTKIKNLLSRVDSEGYTRKDIESWRLFHNIYRPSDYYYFTRVKDEKKDKTYTYPARFRWIPIQRKNLNVLISQQALRPFVHTTRVSDDAGKKRKLYSSLMGAVDFLFEQYKNHEYQIVATKEQLELTRQEYLQVLSKEPQNEAELSEQTRIKYEMPKINAEFSKINDILGKQAIVNSKQIDKLARYYNYDFKDMVEETAEKISIKLRTVNRFREESTEVFTSKIVTGKGFYYVNHESGNKNVTIKAVDDISVIYPRYSNIKWTHEGPWVGIKENWAVEDVLRIHGHEMTNKEKEELKAASKNPTNINPVFASTDKNGALLIQNDNMPYAGTEETNAVEVIRLWYKEEREILAKISPNKHYPSRPFVHFIDSAEYLKKNPIRKNRGEYLDRRYIEDRYYGIRINGNIHLGFRKDEIQPRDANNLSKVYLPIVGQTHSSATKQPYSLVQSTKDLAELYNVINYHRELYIAVSGVKGQIIDTSQKPTDISLAQQRYYRKLGSLYIQTKTKSGRNLGSNYNQWKGYDDSLPSSINQLENILNNIDETLGLIMGVPRQRIGQVVSTDQVGSNEQAVQMSSLVTEILHTEHEQLNARALELGINIQLNYLTKPGDIIDIDMPNEGGQQTFIVPEFDTQNSQIQIYLENNSRTLNIRNKLEQAAMNEYSRQQLPFRSLISVFNTESTKELEKKLEYFAKEAEDLNREIAGAEQEKEERIANAAKELDLLLKQEDTKAKMAQLNFDKEKLAIEMELKNKELELKGNVDFTKIGSERETEAAYLNEQHRASIVDEKLENLKIQMDFLLNLKSLEAQEKANRMKIGTANASSTKKQSKEKIKDK